MKIHIQLINGRQYAFSMNNEAEAAGFIEKLKFWEIFEGKVLRIRNGENCCTFNPHFIEKIHFFSTNDFRWWSPENVLSRKFVSEETYRLKLDAMQERSGTCRSTFRPGEIVAGLAKLILASGSAEHLEFMIMLRPSQEQLMDLSLVFQRPPFPIPWEGGGFILLNPTSISMVRIYPAIVEHGSDWPMAEIPASSPIAGEEASIDLAEIRT